ncbi:hypothetical protein Tco_0693874, partial [Tanacetum coccineum]
VCLTQWGGVGARGGARARAGAEAS